VNRSRQTRAFAVALCAAMALLMQTLLAGWASAAMAGAPSLDAFGNVLCVGDRVDGGADLPPGHAIPNCCALGCQAAPQPLATPSADASWLPEPRQFAVLRSGPRETLHIERPSSDLTRARGPPRPA
jgi:hypothetical protein